MPSSRRSSIPVPLIEARTGTQRGLRRTPVVSRDRAVGSCSHAAHAPGRRAWCVSGTAGPGAPRWGGRGERKGKAIQLGQGYRQPRWWRPPKPRPRPNRRRKRRVKQAIMASLDTGGQVSAAPRAEADIVIRVLQESLRKAILRAEAAEAKLLAPRVELQTQPAQTKYSVLQPHHRGYTQPRYRSMAEKRDARLSRRADRRAAKLMVAQPELPRPEKEEVSAAAVVAAQPELPRPEKGEVIAVAPDTGITTHTSNLGTHGMPPPVSSNTQRKEEKRRHRQQRWEKAQAQQQRLEQLGLLAHQPSHPSLKVHTWGMTAKEWQTARHNYVALYGKPGRLEWKPNFMFTWGRLELVQAIHGRLHFIVTAKSRLALFHFRVNHRASQPQRQPQQQVHQTVSRTNSTLIEPSLTLFVAAFISCGLVIICISLS